MSSRRQEILRIWGSRQSSPEEISRARVNDLPSCVRNGGVVAPAESRPSVGSTPTKTAHFAVIGNTMGLTSGERCTGRRVKGVGSIPTGPANMGLAKAYSVGRASQTDTKDPA